MEIEKSDILCDVFLDKIHLLRRQKGKYLCADFCTQLENLSLRIAEEVYQNSEFRCDISAQHQPPEKISDNLIDLCLECIEVDLQKPQSLNNSPQILSNAQALKNFLSISDDLRSLAACIKFTISSSRPDDHIFAKQTNDHIGNYLH